MQRAGHPDSRTPLTDVARHVHAALVHAPQLLHVLRTQPDRFRKLLRPPFARFSQLSPRAAGTGDDIAEAERMLAAHYLHYGDEPSAREHLATYLRLRSSSLDRQRLSRLYPDLATLLTTLP